jgi:hypothetical protein
VVISKQRQQQLHARTPCQFKAISVKVLPDPHANRNLVAAELLFLLHKVPIRDLRTVGFARARHVDSLQSPFLSTVVDFFENLPRLAALGSKVPAPISRKAFPSILIMFHSFRFPCDSYCVPLQDTLITRFCGTRRFRMAYRVHPVIRCFNLESEGGIVHHHRDHVALPSAQKRGANQ